MASNFSDYVFILCITCSILTTCYYLQKKIKQDQPRLRELTSNARVMPVQTVTEQIQIIDGTVARVHPSVPALPEN